MISNRLLLGTDFLVIHNPLVFEGNWRASTFLCPSNRLWGISTGWGFGEKPLWDKHDHGTIKYVLSHLPSNKTDKHRQQTGPFVLDTYFPAISFLMDFSGVLDWICLAFCKDASGCPNHEIGVGYSRPAGIVSLEVAWNISQPYF